MTRFAMNENGGMKLIDETLETTKDEIQTLESKCKLRGKENNEPSELHSFMYGAGTLEGLAVMINTMNNCGFAQDKKIREFCECVISNLYPDGIPTEPRGW